MKIVYRDKGGYTPGKWKNAPQRFIKEYTDNGFCKIIFGGGSADISSLNDFVGCRGQLVSGGEEDK